MGTASAATLRTAGISTLQWMDGVVCGDWLVHLRLSEELALGMDVTAWPEEHPSWLLQPQGLYWERCSRSPIRASFIGKKLRNSTPGSWGQSAFNDCSGLEAPREWHRDL